MLNMDILLDIKHYDGSDYTNLKNILGAPDRDTFTVTLDTDHYIYVGFYKPIKQLFIDFTTPNTESSTMSYEYYNGTEFTDLEAIDDTSSFTRSGLLQWEEKSDWVASEIDGVSKYWIRISTDTAHSESVYNFMGLIYADDRDLIIQNSYILSANLLMGQSNHLKAHIAARDAVIQYLTHKGYIKVNNYDLESIQAWDLLDIQEVRQAAVFKALANIYLNQSDDQDDHWMAKYRLYEGLYSNAINLVYLSVDTNDDGIKDTSENKTRVQSVRLFR